MKTKETIDTMNEVAGSSYDSLRKLGEINQRAFDRMVDKQFGLMGLWMDAGMAQIRLATEAKGVQELMTGNMAIAKSLTEKLVAENRAAMDIATETREELRSWWEAGVAGATDKWTKIAQKAAV